MASPIPRARYTPQRLPLRSIEIYPSHSKPARTGRPREDHYPRRADAHIENRKHP